MADIMWCPVCMKYHASTTAECCKGPVVYTSSAGYSPLLDAARDLADVAHMVLNTATVYTPPELVQAATAALRKAGEIPGEVGG